MKMPSMKKEKQLAGQRQAAGKVVTLCSPPPVWAGSFEPDPVSSLPPFSISACELPHVHV